MYAYTYRNIYSFNSYQILKFYYHRVYLIKLFTDNCIANFFNHPKPHPYNEPRLFAVFCI